MRTTVMHITFYGNKMSDPRVVGRTNNKETTFIFNVRGSMHHSIIHIENPTRCSGVSKFYFIFI